MAYPRAMDTHPTLPQALWELTPPAVQAYVEALAARLASMGDLAARVVALEALVQALQERLNQPSQHASRPPASTPPSLRIRVALGGSAAGVANRGIRAIRAPSSRWTPWMRWWSSSPSRVPAAPLP